MTNRADASNFQRFDEYPRENRAGRNSLYENRKNAFFQNDFRGEPANLPKLDLNNAPSHLMLWQMARRILFMMIFMSNQIALEEICI